MNRLSNTSGPPGRTLGRLLGQIPPDLVRVFDGSDKNSSGSTLEGFFRRHQDGMPSQMFPDASAFLRALLTPEAERGSVGTGPRNRLLLFGPRDLLFMANLSSAYRPVVMFKKTGERVDQTPITLNLGIGTDGSPLAPTFPAYLELGLQRHIGLLRAGFRSRFRIFSMASVSSLFGEDEQNIRDNQALQQKAIQAYLDRFYPQLVDSVDLQDMQTFIEPLQADVLDEYLERIRTQVHVRIQNLLRGYAETYTDNPDYGLVYAVYHCLPATFRDGSSSGLHVSVGGPGEYAFNMVRFTVQASAPLPRVGLVLNGGVTCRTPPYLSPDQRLAPDLILDRAHFPNVFLRDIKGRMPAKRELDHLLRCLAETPALAEASKEEIFTEYQTFYRNHLL